MSSNNAREKLVSGSIVKTMLSLSIPAILGAALATVSAQLITDVVVLILAVVFMAGAFGKMKKEERLLQAENLGTRKAG